jgi:multicomponent Na+:H+ antiporter subunit D
MTDVSFFHPSLAFIALALLLPWLKAEQHAAWRWLLLVPPVVAIASVVSLTLGPPGPGPSSPCATWA